MLNQATGININLIQNEANIDLIANPQETNLLTSWTSDAPSYGKADILFVDNNH